MLNKKVLSIDIGSKNIKIVVGKQNNNNVMIYNNFMISTPPDSFENGKILDMESLRKAIHTTLQSKGIKVKEVVFTVQSTNIITREMILPATKVKDMDTMIKLEVEQYLPIVIDDYVIEYKIIGSFMEDNFKKSKILVAALPKVMAEDYLKLLDELKLKPLALDINSNSISKLFTKNAMINDENYSFDKSIAVIDLGGSYLNINIMQNGRIRFNRLVGLGGKDIDINIANSFNLTVGEAEQKKLNDTNLLAENHSIQSSNMILSDIVKSNIDGWINEIERIFQYYLSRDRDNFINEIYIYGGSSRLKGITEYLSNALNIPTVKIKKMSNVKCVAIKDKSKKEKCKDKDIECGLNAIGAIIRR